MDTQIGDDAYFGCCVEACGMGRQERQDALAHFTAGPATLALWDISEGLCV
jgi:hypothetical protein